MLVIVNLNNYMSRVDIVYHKQIFNTCYSYRCFFTYGDHLVLLSIIFQVLKNSHLPVNFSISTFHNVQLYTKHFNRETVNTWRFFRPPLPSGWCGLTILLNRIWDEHSAKLELGRSDSAVPRMRHGNKTNLLA